MTSESQTDDLDGDQRHDGNHDDDEIPFVGQQRAESVIAAVDEDGVIDGVGSAAENAQAWRPAEVGESVDAQALVSVGKSGGILGIDDDARRRRHAATGRHKAGSRVAGCSVSA